MAACTPERIAELTALLADAKQALHNLNTGRMARVVVDQNGERVEFTAANRTGLLSYINQLQAELNACSPTTPAEYSGPAGFIF